MATDQAESADQPTGLRYRHLFDHAPICIFVIDLGVRPKTILEMNQRAELVYGYRSAELVGLPADHLVAEEAIPASRIIVR
ncbi:MAG: PAS domain-containing protein [Chloroflexota bacterium]|jgi:PAS domain S-box-containing protein